MARKILVVDDMAGNRKLLRAFLGDVYETEEAANGEQALQTLTSKGCELSAVLLDIHMPVMDGYEVLRQMRANPILKKLPVIIVTGSEDEMMCAKAIALGANDFVSKPYNPEMIKNCLRNSIALYEASGMVRSSQRDELSGLYTGDAFFRAADEQIAEHAPNTLVLAAFDIENFQLVAEQFGIQESERILRYAGREMERVFESVGGLCGRISGESFVGLYPNIKETVDYITHQCKTEFLPPDTPVSLHFCTGRCVAEDKAIAAATLYERALLAQQSVKGSENRQAVYFDGTMFATMRENQELCGQMRHALAERQFEVWYQPQFDHSNGTLLGAEALVRWRHPQKGLISPKVFVPAFEKNGFIYELDRYVWDEVCMRLRKWLDMGCNVQPISVNVSLTDVFHDDFTEQFTTLVQKYRLPQKLLRLEVAESAFIKNSTTLVTKIHTLIASGFTIEIDDFGSGYSSLNTLKDIPAQILKLDMRFLEDFEHGQRSGRILESILHIAQLLDMTVIAEGVETREQADYLASVGCRAVQGYYYRKPMPAQVFEVLLRESKP